MASHKHETPEYRRKRAEFRREVDAGQGWCVQPVCLLPDRRILPGSRFDTAHGDDGSILGPSHPLCNRSDGARKKNAMARRLGVPPNGRWTPAGAPAGRKKLMNVSGDQSAVNTPQPQRLGPRRWVL